MLRSSHLWLLLLAVVLVLSAAPADAQRIVADVEADFQNLPTENQNKLNGIDRVVENYINQRQWAPNDYQYEVPMTFKIYFEKALPVEFEDRYQARVVVSNQTNFQHSDKDWMFAREPGGTLVYTDQFDSFRSMIDFYVYMILGYEFDKVKKFGGQPYYEQAQRFAQMARLSSRYYLGWEKREELVEDVLEQENDYLRYLNFLYYTGEWLYYEERDRKAARQYLLYAIKQIDRIRVEADVKRFYDLNYFNYANALADYEEWSSLSKLASLDPNPDHADFYDKLLRQR